MPEQTLTYPMAQDFLGGLNCECGQVIPDGAPYATRLEGFASGGEPILFVCCVYCESVADHA